MSISTTFFSALSSSPLRWRTQQLDVKPLCAILAEPLAIKNRLLITQYPWMNVNAPSFSKRREIPILCRCSRLAFVLRLQSTKAVLCAVESILRVRQFLTRWPNFWVRPESADAAVHSCSRLPVDELIYCFFHSFPTAQYMCKFIFKPFLSTLDGTYWAHFFLSLVDFGTDSAIPYLQGWRFFPFEHAYFYCEESRHQFHVLRVKRRFGIHSLLRVVICVHISRWTSAELF